MLFGRPMMPAQLDGAEALTRSQKRRRRRKELATMAPSASDDAPGLGSGGASCLIAPIFRRRGD